MCGWLAPSPEFGGADRCKSFVTVRVIGRASIPYAAALPLLRCFSGLAGQVFVSDKALHGCHALLAATEVAFPERLPDKFGNGRFLVSGAGVEHSPTTGRRDRAASASRWISYIVELGGGVVAALLVREEAGSDGCKPSRSVKLAPQLG